MGITNVNNGPMLNAYPDSCGGTLRDIVSFLERPELKDVFSSFYILPSLFHTDLDRGFSVIDYSLNEMLASEEDLKRLNNLGIDLKLDFILNHASVLSAPFQDMIAKGEESEYKDFFINWNRFWENCGQMTEEGYIQPDEKYLKDMFFRKPGLPILMVRFPDGKDVPYWNTFYQEVKYPNLDAQDVMQQTGLQYGVSNELAQYINHALQGDKTTAQLSKKDFAQGALVTEEQWKKVLDLLDSKRKYLGQMDLNIKSPKVWEFYENTLKTLSGYGAKIVRLDAFAYAPKEPGERNFLNEPGTWELLEKIRVLADKYGVELLPEIHASYGEGNYRQIAEKGYMTYDFFLPGLIIDALENGRGETLAKWANELIHEKIRTVNMLGCHDGIPLLDLKGLITEDRIQKLIDIVVARGGYVKDLHGQKNMYYQVNATYYSALGEDDSKMLLARALHLFMPGKPQVWYLDLFAGKNDHEAVKRAGAGGHKEINRSNLSLAQMEEDLQKPVVKRQLELLRFRSTCPAFSFGSEIEVKANASSMTFIWKHAGYEACLTADLKDFTYEIRQKDADGNVTMI